MSTGSPLSQMCEEMDKVMDVLMSGDFSLKDQGEALGLAKGIAILQCMSVDEVRQYAMYRHEARANNEDPLDAYRWATS